MRDITLADHIRGSYYAPATLVEYGDYECPHCGAAHPIVERVGKHFGPKLRFVYRHFPLSQVHPHAESAAETAEFAGAHGAFWQMHDRLFENQDRLGIPVLLALADALELPAPALRSVLESGRFAPKIRNDFLDGVRSGVNGTPTFFVGYRRHNGSFEFEVLVEAIEAELARAMRLAPSTIRPRVAGGHGAGG